MAPDQQHAEAKAIPAAHSTPDDHDSLLRPSKTLESLPGELIQEVSRCLEPQLEPQLSQPFDKLLGNLSHHRTGLSQATVDRPWLVELRSFDGGPAAWTASRDLINFALTSRKISSFIKIQRVVVLYTPQQLVKFFLLILTNPDVRDKVEQLQLHQFLFMGHQVDVLKSLMRQVKNNTGWDINAIAAQLHRKIGYGNVGGNTPNVTLSTVLIHMLPHVSKLHMPYPKSYLREKHHMKVLDLTSSSDALDKEICPPAIRVPPSSDGQKRKVKFRPIDPAQLRHLQLDGVPHYQTFEFSGLSGLKTSKLRMPMHYWTILLTSEAYRGLKSLSLHRIGDPVPRSMDDRIPRSMNPTMCFNHLNGLELHSLNMDEEDLLRMLPAVPALEKLVVFFTCDYRNENDSTIKQRTIDSSLDTFPKRLQHLEIVYIADMDSDRRINPSVMKPRVRFVNLDQLPNIVSLGIDVSSIVSFPRSKDYPALSVLPPKLQTLRLYSATSTSWFELKDVRHIHNKGPLEWECEYYTGILQELTFCLTSVPHQIRQLEMVRSLFLDERVDDHAWIVENIRQGLFAAMDRQRNDVKTAADGAAELLRKKCQMRVQLLWDLETSMGGDVITDRSSPLFWSGGR